MEKLEKFVKNSDREGVKKFIDDHFNKEHGRNLAGIYQIVRKRTDEDGKHSFRLTVFSQLVSQILQFWFEPNVEIPKAALNDVLVELLADVSLLSPSQCAAMCEVIIDNLGCPMTLELLSSLLLHASSTGTKLPWRGTKVTDFKQTIITAVIERLPWKDDIVIHIAKFFREIEPTTAQLALINPVISPYLNSLPGNLLLPFLSQLLPIHPLFLQQVLQRLDPANFDEATLAGVLAECVSATRQSPGISKYVQTLIKANSAAIISDAFKFRLCLLVGSIHRNYQTPTYNALKNAVVLHCDHEIKRYEARWLSETLPTHAPLALVRACTLSASDDKIHLITSCLIEFGFSLLTSKTSRRVSVQGSQMLLTLCQSSAQSGTVQAILDRLLRTLFQNPTTECAELLAKLPCGQLQTSAGWDVISALPSVSPAVAKTLIRLILESCPQIRNELVITLRKCLFRTDPNSRLVAANGLLEIISFFTIDDDNISQNPNGRVCLEALELMRRILFDKSANSTEVRQCLLEGLPDLIRTNRLLKESIFELLKELFDDNDDDPWVLMAVASCVSAYRKIHVHGAQKSQTLKLLFKKMAALVSDGSSCSSVDALILFATEFALETTGIVEKLRELTGKHETSANTSDTSIASTATKVGRKKKTDKQPQHLCLLPSDVLCRILKSDTIHVDIRLYASNALSTRKTIQPHERRRLLGALKDALTKPYVDNETKRCCAQLMSTNLQVVVQHVFDCEDITSARDDLLKELNSDSAQSFFKYFVEMVNQVKANPERDNDLAPLIACVQCLCLLFPDDAALMSDIYNWADAEIGDNAILYMPLLLDLSSHISGGLAILKRLSQRLAMLCGLLEKTDVAETPFEGLHTDCIPDLFGLLNTVIKAMAGQLEWVLQKIELTEDMEPTFIKQLYYLADALSTVAHSEVPLENSDGLFNSAVKVYKVLMSLAKFYSSKNRTTVSPRYPKLVRLVQKVCTPRFEALIMALEEETAKLNIGKKKNVKSQQAIPAFVFVVEQHHHELQKLAKKIDLGDISAPAPARDFKIKVKEVKKHHEDWSDEEVPNSQQIPKAKTSNKKSALTTAAAGNNSRRTLKEKQQPTNNEAQTPTTTKKNSKKKKDTLAVSWPPKKRSTSVPDDQEAEKTVFAPSDDDGTPVRVLSSTRVSEVTPSPKTPTTTRRKGRSSRNPIDQNGAPEESPVIPETRKASPPRKRRRTLGLRR